MLLSAVATSKTDWYFMRGSGLVAFILLTLTVVLGVAGAKSWRSRHVPTAVTAGVHRTVALLAVVFVGLHVTTAVLDSWIGLSVVDVIVPFASHYQPLWIGLGALSLDALAAVVVTSLLRARLGYRAWRLVHWLTWLSWPVAYLHTIGSGTDSTHGWGLAVTTTCAVAFVAAALWRLAPARAPVGPPVAAGARERAALAHGALAPAPPVAPEVAVAAGGGSRQP